jgi:hypothetical protein
MKRWGPEQPQWLYLQDQTLPPPPGFPGESGLGKAWQRLQVLHTPFRTTDPEEYRWIVEWLARLERLFLEDENLEAYYQECFAPESDPGNPGQPLTRPAATPSPRIDHVATIQAQFMEEVFYTLALDRHANAPDNRGWMNLFRRWGRSTLFNARLDAIRSLLTLRFLAFYDYYLRYYPCRIDEDPIPHPWDSEDRRRDPRPPGTFPARTGGWPDVTQCPDDESTTARKPTTQEAAKPGLLPGLYLDSGIREAGTRPPSGGAEASPASGREEPKTDIDRTDQTRRGDTSGESGGSAPSPPNE